jgi:hypothetical protein
MYVPLIIIFFGGGEIKHFKPVDPGGRGGGALGGKVVERVKFPHSIIKDTYMVISMLNLPTPTLLSITSVSGSRGTSDPSIK